VLFTGGLLTGRLRGGVLRDVLGQAMATTGALFALLIAATTLTLMLRILGTDKLVADWVTALPGNELTVVAIVLGAIGLCAFVLDAFEIIFVIVPIVVPPMLIRVADAKWVAVLLLLTLQTSFLLPPFGYALMMVRGTLRYAGSLGALRPRVVSVPDRAMAGARHRAARAAACPCRRKRERPHARHTEAFDRGNQSPHAGYADPDPRSRSPQMTPP
jgi:hypothetical protein